MSAETLELPPLEVVCPRCQGRGGEPAEYDSWWSCRQCEGAGHLPTEFGKRVLALMRHHFRPMLQDATAK